MACGRSKTAEAENDEDTDDIAYYNGDGTKKTVVTSVKSGYSFEGDYIKEDEAQAIVAAMRFKTGDDRNVWFKVVDADGKLNMSESLLSQVSKLEAEMRLSMRPLSALSAGM